MQTGTNTPEVKKRSGPGRIGRLFKYFIISLISLILLIGTTGFVIVKWYKDEVIAYIIGELNKNLLTKVDIGKIEFSVFEKFPHASLSFENVKIKEMSKEKVKDNLLAAKKVFLEFNVFNIFSKKYKIKNIEVENGSLSIRYYEDGSDNFHFVKTSKEGGSEGFQLALEKVTLNNINLFYNDEFTHFYLNGNAQKVKMSGSFYESDYDLMVEGPFFTEALKQENIHYLNKQQCQLELQLKVRNNKLFVFENAGLSVANLHFDIKGKVESEKGGTLFDLAIEGKDIDIKSFISLLPAAQKQKLEGINSTGDLYFKSELKGIATGDALPDIKASFGINKGTISQQGSDVSLTNVNLTGDFYGGNRNKKSFVNVKRFEASVEQGKLSGTFRINDMEHPYIIADANADLDLAKLQEFAKIDTLEALTGGIKVNMKFEGDLKSLKAYSAEDIRHSRTSGKIVISDASFQLKGNNKKPEHINADMNFDNSDIIINTLSGKVFTTDINLKGEFRNILPYLLLENERLEVKADLVSGNLSLGEILAVAGSEKNKTDADYKLHFSEKVDFDINASIDKATFRKFEAGHIKGKLALHNKKLMAEGLEFTTMDGTVVLSGFVDGSDDKTLQVICEGKAQKINVQKMFYQLENFGQNYLEDKHVKGFLSSDFRIRSEWSNTLQVNEDKIYCQSDISIEKGELNNFEPMQNLSRFVEVEELKNIRFSTLKNQIEVKDRTIYIPQMEIKSSALNILVSGQQTFEGSLDYHFKVLLNDLLAKKARKKKENEEFGEVEDDGLGKITLHLSMTGTTENPKFAYDTKGFKQKIQQDIADEKKNLKTILKEEFGLFKRDTTLKTPDKKKPKEIGVEWGNDKKSKPEEEKKPVVKPDAKKENKLFKTKQEKEEKSKENSDDYN